MTGPEHYRRAEELVQGAEDRSDTSDQLRTFVVRCAQVHATLALAAATALQNRIVDCEQWEAAAGMAPEANG